MHPLAFDRARNAQWSRNPPPESSVWTIASRESCGIHWSMAVPSDSSSAGVGHQENSPSPVLRATASDRPESADNEPWWRRARGGGGLEPRCPADRVDDSATRGSAHYRMKKTRKSVTTASPTWFSQSAVNVDLTGTTWSQRGTPSSHQATRSSRSRSPLFGQRARRSWQERHWHALSGTAPARNREGNDAS